MDFAATVDEFSALVMQYERNPSTEILARLEALWRQIEPQLRSAGTALAGALATLVRAASSLVAALSSPAALAVLGVSAAVVAAFLAFWLIALGSIKAVDTFLSRAQDAIEWIVNDLKVALSEIGHSRNHPEWDPCWDAFRKTLEAILMVHGLSATPGLRIEFDNALRTLLSCLFGLGPAENFGLTRSQNVGLRNLLIRLIRDFFPLALGPFAGLLLGADEAEASEDPADLPEIVEKSGTRGVHRRDGIDYSEVTDAPPADEPLQRGQISIDPGVTLRGYSDDQLDARLRTLQRFIAEAEAELAADEAELAELQTSPDPDIERQDVLRRRIANLRKELLRLRAALTNAQRVRDNRPSGAGRPAPLPADGG